MSSFPISDGMSQVTAIGVVLSVITVLWRLAANLRMYQCLYSDDYASIAGLILFMAFAGLNFGIDNYARYEQIPGAWDAAAPYLLKTVYAAEILASPASMTAKGSVLFLYSRVFHPSIRFRRSALVVAGIIIVASVPSLPLFSFYCAPNATTTTWAPSIARTCASASIWVALWQVLSVLTNFVILILPLPMIFRLRLSLTHKLLLSFAFMHGIFALAASITGAILRIQLARIPSSDIESILWFRTACFTALIMELSMTLVTSSSHACWSWLRSVMRVRASSSGSGSGTYFDDNTARHRASSGEKMFSMSDAGYELDVRLDTGSLSRSALSLQGLRRLPDLGSHSIRWAGESNFSAAPTSPTLSPQRPITAPTPVLESTQETAEIIEELLPAPPAKLKYKYSFTPNITRQVTISKASEPFTASSAASPAISSTITGPSSQYDADNSESPQGSALPVLRKDYWIRLANKGKSSVERSTGVT